MVGNKKVPPPDAFSMKQSLINIKLHVTHVYEEVSKVEGATTTYLPNSGIQILHHLLNSLHSRKETNKKVTISVFFHRW